MFFVFAIYSVFAQSQCIATDAAPGGPVNSTNYGTIQQITPCHRLGEYIVISALVIGETYQFTSGVATDYLTLTDDLNNVLTSGLTPISFNVTTVTGIVRLHLHANALCSTETDTFCQAATAIRCTTCTPPPIPANDDCSSVSPTVLINGGDTIILTGTTLGLQQVLAKQLCLKVQRPTHMFGKRWN